VATENVAEQALSKQECAQKRGRRKDTIHTPSNNPPVRSTQSKQTKQNKKQASLAVIRLSVVEVLATSGRPTEDLALAAGAPASNPERLSTRETALVEKAFVSLW
jgi:hypothetical protein